MKNLRVVYKHLELLESTEWKSFLVRIIAFVEVSLFFNRFSGTSVFCLVQCREAKQLKEKISAGLKHIIINFHILEIFLKIQLQITFKRKI